MTTVLMANKVKLTYISSVTKCLYHRSQNKVKCILHGNKTGIRVYVSEVQ